MRSRLSLLSNDVPTHELLPNPPLTSLVFAFQDSNLVGEEPNVQHPRSDAAIDEKYSAGHDQLNPPMVILNPSGLVHRTKRVLVSSDQNAGITVVKSNDRTFVWDESQEARPLSSAFGGRRGRRWCDFFAIRPVVNGLSTAAWSRPMVNRLNTTVWTSRRCTEIGQGYYEHQKCEDSQPDLCSSCRSHVVLHAERLRGFYPQKGVVANVN